MTYYFSILILVAGLASASPLSINFTSANQNGTAGGQVNFTGSLFNNSGAAVSIGGDSSTLDAPLTLDDTAFFTFSPPSVAASTDSGSFLFFTVNIPLLTGFNVYHGNFAVLDNDSIIVGTANFTVTLAPVTAAVPEPSTVVVAAPLLFCVFRWRRLRTSPKSYSLGAITEKERLNN